MSGIEYQTLNKKCLDFSFLPTRVFGYFEGKYCNKIVSFHIWTNYRISDLYGEQTANQITKHLISSVWYF